MARPNRVKDPCIRHKGEECRGGEGEVEDRGAIGEAIRQEGECPLGILLRSRFGRLGQPRGRVGVRRMGKLERGSISDCRIKVTIMSERASSVSNRVV